VLCESAEWWNAKKIARLNTAVVEANFDWMFVYIETDEGVKGTDECFLLRALLRPFVNWSRSFRMDSSKYRKKRVSGLH
jgi:L-alanine-DL-glutamate epimerase-like enolase superfamily enzyme